MRRQTDYKLPDSATSFNVTRMGTGVTLWMVEIWSLLFRARVRNLEIGKNVEPGTRNLEKEMCEKKLGTRTWVKI